MATVDLVMPKLGESIMEATILKWHKKPGDQVKEDEPVLDIATDKVDSEVPSTANGVISELLYNENDVVSIGDVIARIQTDAAAQPDNTAYITAPGTEPVPADDEIPYVPASATISQDNGGNNGFFSPLVLNIAKSEGVSFSELEHIAGTGNEGRVTKKDILQFVANRKEGVQPTAPTAAKEQEKIPVADEQPAKLKDQLKPPPFIAKEEAEVSFEPTPAEQSGNIEIIEMDRMRKLIAKHMVDSKHISPHVTSFSEADVTNMVRWRDKVKNEFQKREGTKITYMPLFIECIAKVIKRYPLVNCSVEDDKIIIKKDINIGMATALPNGNLIVPVIKNADHLNLVGLSKAVNTMAENARNNRLKSDDISNGTFTVTNVGTFGSLAGTPIINQPQVAVLAVGIIKKRPVVIEGPEGDLSAFDILCTCL